MDIFLPHYLFYNITFFRLTFKFIFFTGKLQAVTVSSQNWDNVSQEERNWMQQGGIDTSSMRTSAGQRFGTISSTVDESSDRIQGERSMMEMDLNRDDLYTTGKYLSEGASIANGAL